MITTGKLEYLGWGHSWALHTDGIAVSVKGLFWDLALRLQNKTAAQDITADSYILRADPESPFRLEFNMPGEGIALFRRNGFGFSNVAAYLDDMLMRFNMRSVTLEQTDTLFRLSVDHDDDVLGVQYFGRGNSARVPAGAERTVCKIGTPDCCIFLAVGSHGFSCEKFNSTGRMLLDRHVRGEMRASRIGDCKVTGREPQEGNYDAAQ